MSIEFFFPSVDMEVRQGDVLLSRTISTGQIDEICLVITADCDISKGKFGRQLACLRVITLEDYLRTKWAEKKLEKLKKTELDSVRDRLAKWHSHKLQSKSSITSKAVHDWVLRDSPEEICESLQVPVEEQKKVFLSLRKYKSSWERLVEISASDFLVKYVEYRAIAQEKTRDVCWDEVLKDATKEIESLPEDVFVLTELPQVDCSGAVVLLREVVGVPYESVFYRASDVVGENGFLRVGRLESQFKYAVSQAFGALFSKIGLPNEYEEKRKSVFSGLVKIDRG